MNEVNYRQMIHGPERVCQVFALPEGNVDVWSISLDRAVGDGDWDVLEPSERARAHRFRKETDRDRYVVGRSVLRRILGTYLDRAPERLEFEYGKHGKPFLAKEGLHFNVSHSDGKSLVAVTWVCPVGVDLEPETRVLDIDGLVQTVCSPSERAKILSLPSSDRCLAFLRVWVRKEAFLKLTGEGLSRPLSQLDVEELPVRLFDAVSGFVSALALSSLTPQ